MIPRPVRWLFASLAILGSLLAALAWGATFLAWTTLLWKANWWEEEDFGLAFLALVAFCLPLALLLTALAWRLAQLARGPGAPPLARWALVLGLAPFAVAAALFAVSAAGALHGPRDPAANPDPATLHERLGLLAVLSLVALVPLGHAAVWPRASLRGALRVLLVGLAGFALVDLAWAAFVARGGPGATTPARWLVDLAPLAPLLVASGLSWLLTLGGPGPVNGDPGGAGLSCGRTS